MIKKTFKHIKRFGWLLLAIIVFVLARGYYTRDGIKTLAVKEVKIENKVVEKTVSASGKVKSENSANLSFNGTGRIAQITVKKGDTVKKGQLLSYLDTQSFNQTIQTYKDARDIAIRDKELFVSQYEDDKSAIGGQDDYDINIRRYDEKISQASASYNSQKDSLRNSYIYAPFDGVVVDATKEVGENASLGETIIKLENLNKIIFEIELDQEDYGSVKLGQTVLVDLDAYSDVKFGGKVSLLPLYADGTSGSNFTVEVTLDPSKEMSPLVGMTGDAKIIVAVTDKEVPVLLYDQVFFDDEDKPYVYVVNAEGLIEKQIIEIGLEGDIYTELKTNLDKPIITGINDQIEVTAGYKAKLIKQ